MSLTLNVPLIDSMLNVDLMGSSRGNDLNFTPQQLRELPYLHKAPLNNSLAFAYQSNMLVENVGNTTGIYVGDRSYTEYKNIGVVSGAGHIVNKLNHLYIDAPGQTIPLFFANENKGEVLAGVVNFMILNESQLSTCAGQINNLYCNRASINPVDGWIDDASAYHVPSGFKVANIGNCYAFNNEDTASPIRNMSATYLDLPVFLGNRTKATVPSATTYVNYSVMITDAVGANPGLCLAKGGQWILADGSGTVVV